MTRHLLHALAALYALIAVALFHSAVTSWQHGAPYHAAVLLVATLLLTTSVVHHSYHRDELRAVRVQLEHATRPADCGPALEDAVAIELAAACCERWWTSCGAEHDTTHCTRKDQTT